MNRLAKQNKDARKFFSAAARDKLDQYIDDMDPVGYRPASMDKLLFYTADNAFLYETYCTSMLGLIIR